MRFARKNYYEILDVDPSASADEVAQAYRMVKTTFEPGSMATYSLYTSSESELISRKIEEAFQILTDGERRRRYDLYLKQVSGAQLPPDEPEAFWEAHEAPVEAGPQGVTELLTAASVPVGQEDGADAPHPSLQRALATQSEIEREWEELIASGGAMAEAQKPVEAAPLPQAPLPETPSEPIPLGKPKVWVKPGLSTANAGAGWRRKNIRPLKAARPPLQERAVSPEQIAALEAEFGLSGAFIKGVRELKGISVESIAERTKIGSNYLRAIEGEAFGDLPPAVYLRGFLTQYIKLLKLDVKRVVDAYMERCEPAQ